MNFLCTLANIYSCHRCEDCMKVELLDVIGTLIPSHLLITWENYNFINWVLFL